MPRPNDDRQEMHAATARPGINHTRRRLLQWLGAGLAGTGTAQAKTRDMVRRISEEYRQLADRVEVTLARPEDMLELRLEFTGFRLSPDRQSLQRKSSPNLLIVTFAPQSLAEQAFPDAAGAGEFSPQRPRPSDPPITASEAPRLPARTRLAGESRLVFSIPASITRIPLTLQALLDWDRLTPVVNKRAASPRSMPLFTPQDLGSGLFQNPALGPRPNPQVGPELRTLPVPDRRDPAQRQADLNRNVRSATRTEQRAIIANEAPPPGSADALMRAALRFGRTPRPLDPEETCIEMPFRLFLSPNEYGAWDHATALRWKPTGEGALSRTVALWHTRLTCRNCTGGKDLSDALRPIRSVRALWGTDIDGDHTRKPARDTSFPSSLYNDDRHAIVHESSNWALPGGFTPRPVRVDNLMMSALGGWLDAELAVPSQDLDTAGLSGSLNLLKWKHVAALARDHYVEVVYSGNLLPFGHEASLVRITERKPWQGYAVNRQRYFISITEAERKYDTRGPRDGQFRHFNFSTIRFLTTSTPSIDAPSAFCDRLQDRQADKQFVPRWRGRDIRFRILAFDLEGNEVDFEAPVVFVSKDVTRNAAGNPDTPEVAKLVNCYNNAPASLNRISLRQQTMALARSHNPGDTRLEVGSVRFHMAPAPDEDAGFRPVCREFEVFLGAVEDITGKRSTARVELVDDEADKPANTRRNKGMVFARLLEKIDVGFSGGGQKTGGSLSPDFTVTALSKTLGAVGGDLQDALTGRFDPTKVFRTTARLFGVIDLSRIIRTAENAATNARGADILSAIPALRTLETPEARISQYTWNAATLKAHDFGFVKFQPKGNGAGKLKVDTRLHRYKDPSRQDTLTVKSSLSDFEIEVASIAAVGFKRVGFTVDTAMKTDFTVDMADTPIRFLGALSFVNDLQRFIPADGFSDPPFLDITPSGITSGYTLALPDVQLGVFTLRNISLAAAVRLPFDGSPLSLRFAFCEKQQPFTLTVSALGGGGFFAVEFDMNGLRSLEAALEFGAAVSLDLGVASGAVSVMGGIYFRMTTSDGANDYVLEGYLRINGALSVLGLITVSVEFLMALAAVMQDGKVEKVRGEATLRVKVEVFLFSKTVTLQVSREFAGAGADPTFAMLVNGDDWQEYCEAFAA